MLSSGLCECTQRNVHLNTHACTRTITASMMMVSPREKRWVSAECLNFCSDQGADSPWERCRRQGPGILRMATRVHHWAARCGKSNTYICAMRRRCPEGGAHPSSAGFGFRSCEMQTKRKKKKINGGLMHCPELPRGFHALHIFF